MPHLWDTIRVQSPQQAFYSLKGPIWIIPTGRMQVDDDLCIFYDALEELEDNDQAEEDIFFDLPDVDCKWILPLLPVYTAFWETLPVNQQFKMVDNSDLQASHQFI